MFCETRVLPDSEEAGSLDTDCVGPIGLQSLLGMHLVRVVDSCVSPEHDVDYRQ